MSTLLVVIVVAVGVTYAVNTWKIRMVARSRALPAGLLEALQGFLFVYVLVNILDGSNQTLGVVGYVAGAFLGTVAAVKVMRRRSPEPVPPHHHSCCPPPEQGDDVPDTLDTSQPAAPLGGGRSKTISKTIAPRKRGLR